MDFVTPKEKAAEWGISLRRVQILCETSRIDGVIKFGKVWAIPHNARKPIDGRFQQSRGGLVDGK